MSDNQLRLTRIDVGSFVKASTIFSIITGFIVSVISIIIMVSSSSLSSSSFLADKTTMILSIIGILICGPAIIGLDGAILSFIFCCIFNYSLKRAGGITFNSSGG